MTSSLSVYIVAVRQCLITDNNQSTENQNIPLCFLSHSQTKVQLLKVLKHQEATKLLSSFYGNVYNQTHNCQCPKTQPCYGHNTQEHTTLKTVQLCTNHISDWTAGHSDWWIFCCSLADSECLWPASNVDLFWVTKFEKSWPVFVCTSFKTVLLVQLVTRVQYPHFTSLVCHVPTLAVAPHVYDLI